MAGNAMNRANRAQIDAMVSRIPPEVRRQIAADAIDSQKSILAFPYYSTVRFNAALTGAGPFVYTVPSGTRKAFNYKIGDIPGAGSGFSTTFQAGKDETNLLKASETRDNADVLIWGIAAEVTPDSDPFFAAQIWRNAYVELALNGTDNYLLGPLGFFPQAGGLYGAGSSGIREPSVQQALDIPRGVLTNGNPTAGNYYRLPQPVRWESNGSGKKDTSLVVSCTVDSAIAFTTSLAADRAAVAGGANTSGTNAWTHPADGAVYVDIRFRLLSVSISERSTNT